MNQDSFRPWVSKAVRVYLAVFLCTPIALAQTTIGYDVLYQTVITKHGGRALEVRNSQTSGTITYRGESTGSPFSLTLQRSLVRLEITKSTGKLSIIRRGQRVQAIRGQKRDLAELTSFSSSGSNIVPIFALMNFHNDPRFSRVVVQENGIIGLQYTEGSPPGVAPLLSGPKLIASFWLDNANRIARVTYTNDQNTVMPVTYFYSYPVISNAPFLRPDFVQALSGEYKAYEARLSDVRVDVPLPNDFFDITE